MKTKALIYSIVIHLAVLLIALFITFDFPAPAVSLGYGNVEFSTVAKDISRKKNKENFRGEKIQKNSGEGEPVLKDESPNLPPVNENKAQSFLSGKFSIDFQGKRRRAIYSYVLPDYPNGVDKEADIVLRITIEPDGTVSRVFPLIKADTRLEIAAINAVKNWRFEPLPNEIEHASQDAMVVFPYRLH